MVIWKDVLGYEEYFKVSNDGKIYSKRTNKLLSLCKNKSGYIAFTTRLNGRGSKSINLRVHRLVATAFINNPLNKKEVNHLDGDKSNNNDYNLEWSTSKENTQHALNNGLIKTKLSYDEKVYIKNNFINGDKILGARALGRKFNVTHRIILKIVNS